MKQRQEFLQSEREIAATLSQHRNEVKQDLETLRTVLSAQYAFLDAFARVVLHCIPDPTANLRETAKATPN